MNILITGICGFVGTNLIKVLKKVHTLYGLDIIDVEKQMDIKRFSWTEFEPSAFPLQTLPKFDVIIHLSQLYFYGLPTFAGAHENSGLSQNYNE